MRAILSYFAIIAFFFIFFLVGAKSPKIGQWDLLGLCVGLSLIGVLTISAICQNGHRKDPK